MGGRVFRCHAGDLVRSVAAIQHEHDVFGRLVAVGGIASPADDRELASLDELAVADSVRHKAASLHGLKGGRAVWAKASQGIAVAVNLDPAKGVTLKPWDSFRDGDFDRLEQLIGRRGAL